MSGAWKTQVASETVLGRVGAWLTDLDALRHRRFEGDDLAGRGLVRAPLADVRRDLDDLKARLGLPPIELEGPERRLVAHRRA